MAEMVGTPDTGPPFTAEILTTLSEVSAQSWDSLGPNAQPFAAHRFLSALEQSGSVGGDTGWTPCHILLRDAAGELIGAAPFYAKSHSQGEYVFDQNWAAALARTGHAYYPKLQGSIPFTPITGPRLLTPNPDHKTALLQAMIETCHASDMSGVHLTFLDPQDRAACEQAGFLIRKDHQFHFINHGYETFDGFLGRLSSRKRKNIRKERRAAQDGLTIKRLCSDDIKPHHWDIFYSCYMDTTMRKWGRAYLTRAFFDRLQHTMRDDILLVMAWEDDTPIAAALNFIDQTALYGRNWGALTHKPFLHFELCYYQAIEAGLERGLARVEAGAQGGHKLARGYAPVPTYSAHYLTHPGLRDAVETYLTHERRAESQQIDFLSTHTPFRKTDGSGG